jgi:putative FmdB family regulatory protein
MPTYEYKCPSGHLFEKFSPSMTDQRHARCPECGKKAERQISGGAGLVFKGSGFYITDYKRAGDKKAADGDGKAVASEKDATKSEKDSTKKDSPKKESSKSDKPEK